MAHSQFGNQAGFLVNGTDAGLLGITGRLEMDGTAVPPNLPTITWIDPGQDTHQSRFSGAVFTQQHMYFAALHFQAHIIQRRTIGKVFMNRFHAQNGWLFLNLPHNTSQLSTLIYSV